MLINSVNEANDSEQISDLPAECHTDDHACEYQTADELFELMARNHQYDCNGHSLSPSDLVILYRNIEMGTQLMSGAETLNCSKSNQYVETVVYNEDPDSDGTDSSEIYSSDDLYNVVLFNKDRIDLLSNPSSLKNTLCNKLGDIEMPTANISVHYNKRFLYNNPYINEQLTNLNIILKSTSEEFNGPLLSSSLLDYISCKRMDNNYDFYMDNIIKYVQHTIEQLRRISNGDYLTDRAKEKWKESNYADNKHNDFENMKILATSASIPLQVEQKANFHYSTWDDIIHSEVDVRSLCKILEKKVVVEIPKLIQGSYKLFSKLHSDNLVLCCKKRQESKNNSQEARLDVVLKLGHSETGQVINNISSIVIYQNNPQNQQGRSTTALLPLLCNEIPAAKEDQQLHKTVEIEEVKEEIVPTLENFTDFLEVLDHKNSEVADTSQRTECDSYDNDNYYLNNIFSSSSDCAESRDLDTGVLVNILQQESFNNMNSSDDLVFSTQRLIMDSLPEESYEEVKKPVKMKSPTKIRVKSPYENKSFLMEEKKRKKLLEIRERREKKKMAMNESCKISKHKYGKGSIMPRPSSSVTKLSITNKSFYNSIYGQNAKDDNMQTSKSKSCKGKKDMMLENSFEQTSEILSPDTNNKKYVDRSYYLDEAVTEIMYTEPSEHSSDVRDLFSVSTSVLSSDLGPNISSIPPTINSPCDKSERFDETNESNDTTNKSGNELDATSLHSIRDNEPSTSYKSDHKKAIPIECRKSIDKIYGLMKKLGNDTLESKSSPTKCMTSGTNNIETNVAPESSLQYSDSGTSLKHLLESSNPSSFSFDKIPTIDQVSSPKSDITKKVNGVITVVPKVIISAKQSAIKMEGDKMKKERKKIAVNIQKIPDNPLKAISQLLHEFDSVQRTRHKITVESKGNKKSEVSFENRNISRQGALKTRLHLETPDVIKHEPANEKNKVVIRERKVKPSVIHEPLKILHQPSPTEDRQIDRTRKRLADIIDEVKEAKGEAVRGPSKFTSRLNTLAQPKKSYVQAHSEEYQTKYGRTLMADRLQRLAGSQAPMQTTERHLMSGSARGRSRRSVEPVAGASKSQQPPSLPPLERGTKHRRSASASPEKPAEPDVTLYKQSHDPDAPETLKNKMVAVESYVKSHYGRAATANGDHARMANKARVPLVPHDLDFSPVPSSPTGEESAAIGNKLHCIINSIMKVKPGMLAALAESPESDSKHSQEDQFNDELYHSRDDKTSSVDSEYRADIFEDKNVKTAVQNFLEDKSEETVTEETSERSYAFKYGGVETSDSTTALEELENALHRRISVGAFSKRLRLKKLTITPKQSMQQMFLAQSGDAESGLLIQSAISKNLKVNISQANSEIKLREIRSLVQPQLDWRVTSIPLQITTVGYAFPQYDMTQCSSNFDIKSIVDRTLNDDAKRSQKSLLETNSTQNIIISRCDPFLSDIDKEAKQDQPPDKLTPIPMETATATKEIFEDGEFENTSKSFKNSIYQVRNVKNETNNHINYTSSLDMLVGILNEIQKITACHITSTETCDNQECKQLENVLCNDDTKCIVNLNKSQDLISITSLDRLRQLDSNASIYSLYISNDESEEDSSKVISNVNIALFHDKSKFADKEVSADFPEKQLTSTFTDVPSLFPLAVTHSTNVTESLMRILCIPSNRTVISDPNDNDENYSELSIDRQNKLIEISPSTVIKKTKPYSTMSSEIANVLQTAVIKQKHIKDTQMDEIDVSSFKANNSLLKGNQLDQLTLQYNVSNYDPLLKIKRDILVTVYSMLVLTVFAALSFPDILYLA
ncbi:hypothetical protein evm_011748 [Chilo suppressalis]|nr:hypothetical protein evm_011748 [Chilo suppressalis]